MSDRILIIDDEEHIRRMIRLTLEAAGYEVGEASDGAEGIRRYGDGSNWSGVVLDQRMPGMVITMNAFTILESEGPSHESNERRFLVKSPTGGEHEVLVQIDDEVVGYVERMTRRRLPAANSFWTTQAQRLLSDYLWKEGKVPPTRKLTIKDVDRDELPIAARWQST